MVHPTLLTARDKRKLRREFRRKGYRAVYLEVSGYPQGKREFAHVWLREKERSSDRRKRWTFAFRHHGNGGGGIRCLSCRRTAAMALGDDQDQNA
jgi:hypothetical protein